MMTNRLMCNSNRLCNDSGLGEFSSGRQLVDHSPSLKLDIPPPLPLNNFRVENTKRMSIIHRFNLFNFKKNERNELHFLPLAKLPVLGRSHAFSGGEQNFKMKRERERGCWPSASNCRRDSRKWTEPRAPAMT